MKSIIIYLILLAGAAMLFSGCKDKNTTEACLHQATMDLDAGKYDDVLASSCADSLQRGAAYFGRAGFDTNHVLNTFVRTGVSSGATSTRSDLTVYMTSLIGVVGESTLTSLDSSAAEYTSIPTASDTYRDAQFYLSLVATVKSLSLLKLITSDLTGALDLSCDINGNSSADGADAAACALIAASTISASTTSTCSNASYAPATPVDITFTGKSGTYSGLTVTLTGTATLTCPGIFQKLLYKDALGRYWVAVTTADTLCAGSDGNPWPCPLEQNGLPLDLVDAVDASLDSSVSALHSSLTSTSGDVQNAIQGVKTDACPAGTCTSIDIASYLETIH